MPSPFLPAKIVLFALFALSLVGMMIGFLLTKTSMFVVGVPIAVLAAMSAIRQFGRWMRVTEMERRWLEGNAGFEEALDIPERIFVLLCTVAESDGAAGPRERALIRQFVLERFPDPLLAIRLARWDVRPLDAPGLRALLRDLRRRLPRSDRETLFHWCALVALIDERFNRDEHDVLQAVARELGLEPEQARILFLHAKARVLGERAWRGSGGGFGGGFGGQDDWGPRTAGRPDRRAAALETLGLGADATAEEIRRRHRELVKKHHPDTQSHLGPVAQQEATERFRRIQAAYETLTDAR